VLVSAALTAFAHLGQDTARAEDAEPAASHAVAAATEDRTA